MTGKKFQAFVGTALALSCLIVGSIHLSGAELVGTAEQRLLKDIKFLASDEMESKMMAGIEVGHAVNQTSTFVTRSQLNFHMFETL